MPYEPHGKPDGAMIVVRALGILAVAHLDQLAVRVVRANDRAAQGRARGRGQLALLYLTMPQPDDSLAIWAPLEDLDETAALKAFKRGLEALIRDDFPTCIACLQQGIDLIKQNAMLNDDMTQVIEKVWDGSVIATSRPPAASGSIVQFGEPSRARH